MPSVFKTWLCSAIEYLLVFSVPFPAGCWTGPLSNAVAQDADA